MRVTMLDIVPMGASLPVSSSTALGQASGKSAPPGSPGWGVPLTFGQGGWVLVRASGTMCLCMLMIRLARVSLGSSRCFCGTLPTAVRGRSFLRSAAGACSAYSLTMWAAYCALFSYSRATASGACRRWIAVDAVGECRRRFSAAATPCLGPRGRASTEGRCCARVLVGQRRFRSGYTPVPGCS